MISWAVLTSIVCWNTYLRYDQEFSVIEVVRKWRCTMHGVRALHRLITELLLSNYVTMIQSVNSNTMQSRIWHVLKMYIVLHSRIQAFVSPVNGLDRQQPTVHGCVFNHLDNILSNLYYTFITIVTFWWILIGSVILNDCHGQFNLDCSKTANPIGHKQSYVSPFPKQRFQKTYVT